MLLEIASHVGVKGIRGLAIFLEVPESNLYSWISRDSIGDKSVILKKIPNARIEWLETGEGEIFTQVVGRPVQGKITIHEIPVLGRISAGFPNIAAEEIIEYISIPGTPENSFALVVKGASMEPTFRDGDYVLFVENGEYKTNDVLIVLDEWGEAMIKRMKEKEGKRFLTSDNPAYPVVEPNEHYRIIGKVVKVWRDIKF